MSPSHFPWTSSLVDTITYDQIPLKLTSVPGWVSLQEGTKWLCTSGSCEKEESWFRSWQGPVEGHVVGAVLWLLVVLLASGMTFTEYRWYFGSKFLVDRTPSWGSVILCWPSANVFSVRGTSCAFVSWMVLVCSHFDVSCSTPILFGVSWRVTHFLWTFFNCLSGNKETTKAGKDTALDYSTQRCPSQQDYSQRQAAFSNDSIVFRIMYDTSIWFDDSVSFYIDSDAHTRRINDVDKSDQNTARRGRGDACTHPKARQHGRSIRIRRKIFRLVQYRAVFWISENPTGSRPDKLQHGIYRR